MEPNDQNQLINKETPISSYINKEFYISEQEWTLIIFKPILEKK